MSGQPTDWKGRRTPMKYLCYIGFVVKDSTVHELTSCKKDQQVTNMKEVHPKFLKSSGSMK
jgi:hypothetical protein